MQVVEQQMRLVGLTGVEEAKVVLKRACVQDKAVPKKVVARLAEVTELKFGGPTWDESLGPQRVVRLARCLGGLRCLTRLNLANNELQASGVEELARAFPTVPSLTSIDLGYNDVRDEGARALATYLPSLPALSEVLLPFNGIKESGTGFLCRALQRLVFLEAFAHLELTGNRVGSAGARALAEAMGRWSGLQSLGLGCVAFADDGASALVESIGAARSLRVLNLRTNHCGPAAARRIVEAATSQLAGLDLGRNDLAPGDDAFSSGSHSASKRARRQSEEDAPPASSPDDLIGLAAAFALKTALTELSLESNNLRDEFVAAIAQFLPSMPRLAALNLSFNVLTTFEERLCDLPALTSLDLSFNHISRVPDRIGDSNVSNSLRRLDLRKNKLLTLPRSIVRLRNTELLIAQNVDLRDPPLPVATRGIDAIARYFEVTTQSREENSIDKLLYSADALSNVHQRPLSAFPAYLPIPGSLSHHPRSSSIDTVVADRRRP